ncbi:MAG: trigger factor [Candidatus Buchananbacteria bacterium]|nr:trigger factor [Candidatus Buchananbacteria bacterium]
MKVESKKIGRGQIELTIEIGIDEYQPFLEKAAQAISQTTKIAGFRPGKASLDIVKKQVGEGRIWEEAIEPAVQKTFVQALDQEKLITVGSPNIDIVKLAPGNPVVYKATIALLPAVKLADYTQLKVKSKEVKVEDKQIEEVLNDLQRRRAKETLANREAKNGDKVEIDFEVFIDNVPIENGAQKNFPLVLGEGSFIPGFEENLVGLKKDEVKEFKLEFPKDYHQKTVAGKQAEFRVTVRGVYDLDLPKIDDEFAKSLGGFKTVDELKKQVRENLEHEAKHKEDHRVEDEMFDKIIEKSQFDDIPDILINSETKKMLDELSQNLAGQGVKFEDYLTHLKKSENDLLLEFAPQAVRRVKGALVTRAVGDQQKVAVDDKEVEEELKKTLENYGGNADVEKQINTPEYRGYVRNILAARKVTQHLKDTMIEK